MTGNVKCTAGRRYLAYLAPSNMVLLGCRSQYHGVGTRPTPSYRWCLCRSSTARAQDTAAELDLFDCPLRIFSNSTCKHRESAGSAPRKTEGGTPVNACPKPRNYLVSCVSETIGAACRLESRVACMTDDAAEGLHRICPPTSSLSQYFANWIPYLMPHDLGYLHCREAMSTLRMVGHSLACHTIDRTSYRGLESTLSGTGGRTVKQRQWLAGDLEFVCSDTRRTCLPYSPENTDLSEYKVVQPCRMCKTWSWCSTSGGKGDICATVNVGGGFPVQIAFPLPRSFMNTSP